MDGELGVCAHEPNIGVVKPRGSCSEFADFHGRSIEIGSESPVGVKSGLFEISFRISVNAISFKIH